MVASQYQILSQVIGWTYFTCWSFSFYPQVILNWRRKSVEGLSIDYAFLNTLGHLSYAAYSLNFYFNPAVRQEYRHRHQGHDSSVQINDVAFSVHAVAFASLTLAQTFWYQRGPDQRLSTYNKYVITGVLSAVLFNIFAVTSGNSLLIDLLYNLSFFKLYVSIAKYVPQAWLNYDRKSTVGWSIENVLLDFTGGALSMIQLLLDASLSGDWAAVTGNPVKFGLSLLTVIFDLLFMTQHFLLYQDHTDKKLKQVDVERDVNERAPLLRVLSRG